MTAAITNPSPRWSLPVLVLGCLAVVVFFVLLHPPGYRAAVVEPAPLEAEGGDAVTETGNAVMAGDVPGLSAARIQVVPVIPTIVAPEQRAGRVLVLRLGPDDRYLTVGQIANGARVEVVGRNEKGDWLAISLNPGAKTYGWVRATGVTGIVNVAALPVAPVRRLP